MIKKIYPLLLSALIVQSCATLFTGTKDKIKFESEPIGATVRINGIDMGTTPCEIAVRRKLVAPQVTLKKEGYQDRNFQLSSKFNAVAVLNLFSPFHWGIDVLTGSVKKYDLKLYNTKLDKK